MKYYLIAGEASGDLHASHLMKELLALDSKAEFRFYGGEKMASVGGTLVRHYKTLAYMGFVQVALHLRTILKGMKECKQDIIQWQPDALILIDYPGFNLKVAEFIRQNTTIPIYYYIAPKIWAWKENRIKRIRRDVDMVLSILPFETEYFKFRHNYDVKYVGNPTYDEIDDFCKSHAPNSNLYRKENNLDERPIIALLPGSRKAEIQDNLFIMLDAVKDMDEKYQIIISKAPGITEDFYNNIRPEVQKRLVQQSFPLLQHAKAALVTSGTATLETALFGVPQVVCYYMRGGWLLKLARRFFLKIQYISLVNLIAGREVVTELVGMDMNKERLRKELLDILPDGKRHSEVKHGYLQMSQRLGETGAPRKAATNIILALS